MSCEGKKSRIPYLTYRNAHRDAQRGQQQQQRRRRAAGGGLTSLLGKKCNPANWMMIKCGVIDREVGVGTGSTLPRPALAVLRK